MTTSPASTDKDKKHHHGASALLHKLTHVGSHHSDKSSSSSHKDKDKDHHGSPASSRPQSPVAGSGTGTATPAGGSNSLHTRPSLDSVVYASPNEDPTPRQKCVLGLWCSEQHGHEADNGHNLFFHRENGEMETKSEAKKRAAKEKKEREKREKEQARLEKEQREKAAKEAADQVGLVKFHTAQSWLF